MKIMKTILYVIVVVYSTIMLSCTTIKHFSTNGWKMDVDLEKELASISHKNLGTVLNNIRLYTVVDNRNVLLTQWNYESDDNKLTITASNPIEVTWEFTFKENNINVSTPVNNTSIIAFSPAPKNRFPVRIADPENLQEHSTEGSNDYTGVAQIEKYFVPPENPQVMYMSLGAVDSPNLHALFDKDSNIVVQFSSDSQLKRWQEDQSIIQVEVPVGGNKNLLHLIKNYFTDVLGMPNYVPYDDTYHKSAPTGWNHWLAFFRQVTEKDIVDHADFISKELKPYGMEHCQLDDGYDHPDRRLWSKNWDPETFPHGPEWLAQYIQGKGLIPGLWTVPYCYSVNDADSSWFLRDDDGNILFDYQGGAELDFTNPEVIQQYWIPLWKEFKRQGWKYYKFDMGNTSSMWYHYQHNFSDTSQTSFEVSHETMTLFRDIMGPEIWYTNHPDVYGGRMGFIDVAGCGRDPAPGWTRMNNFLEVISNNAFQNHIIWYSDPDCIVLRGKPTRADAGFFRGRYRVRNKEFLTLEEARTCATLLSLSGMQYLSGDDLLNLEKDRLNIIKKTIPTLPIFPIDLFSRSRYKKYYPEIVDLKISAPSGVYDVIAVTNWENIRSTRNILINKELALEEDASYLVFDNWKEHYVGTFKSNFQIELPEHGTGVFTIRRQETHPQLLATNRHISGTISIKKNVWNNTDLTLNGVSETVPDVTYTMFFYVPSDFSIDVVNIDRPNLTYNLDENRLLTVSFTGQEDPASWFLKFSNKTNL